MLAQKRIDSVVTIGTVKGTDIVSLYYVDFSSPDNTSEFCNCLNLRPANLWNHDRIKTGAHATGFHRQTEANIATLLRLDTSEVPVR
jgi:hypothetical protein